MKQVTGSIEYKAEFLEMALSFLDNYYKLDIDTNSMFKLSSKEKEVLLKLCKIYSKIKLVRDYKMIKLSYITTDEALELANDFLIRILPHQKEEIMALDNLIVFDNITTYQAGLSYRLSKDKVELDEILLPNKCSYYDSATITHEKTHALTFNNLNLVSLFQNGIELFPMTFEKMMLADLEDITATTYDKIIRINDTKDGFFNLDSINYLKEIPIKTELDQIAYNYFNIKSYDYLISEFKSNLLARYYQLDKETMIKRLNALFSGKITIETFLDSYNISLLNKDLIPIIKEETDKCKRITIIP